MPDRSSIESSPKPVSSAWPWATAWMVTVLICAGAGLFVFQSCGKLPQNTVVTTANAVTNVARALADVATAFRHQTITTSFASYATSLQPNQYLQFATLKQNEVFSQTDQTVTGFGYIPLPEIVVEARAPVEFTYHLDLNAKWEFTLKDEFIVVQAPRIRFNKPAIDAAEVEYQVRKGSFFRDHSEALDNLKSSITSLAQLRAKENIALVRETGRRQVAKFVENWLAHAFSDGKNYPVKVYFEGETLEPAPNLVEIRH